jgi:hypothetical protein
MIRSSTLALISYLALSIGLPAADKLSEWSRHLPENTIATVQIKNFAEVVADWEKSSVNRFLNDPEVQKWLAPALEGSSMADKFKEATGTSFTDAVATTPGSALLSFVFDLKKVKAKNPKPNLVIFAELEGDGTKYMEVQQRQVEAYKKGKHPGAVIVTEDIGGQKVSAIAESDATDAKWIVGWAAVDGVLVESDDRKLLEASLADMKAGRPSNLEKKLTRLVEINGKQSDVSLAVDLEPLIKLAEDSLKEAVAKGKSTIPVDPDAILSAVGLKALQALEISMDLTEGQSTADFTILQDQEGAGLFQSFFKGTSTEVPLPAFVPAGVDTVAVSRQSLGNIWQALMDGVQKLGPMAAMITMKVSATEQQVGMTLKDDLFGSMDDTFVQIQAFGAPSGPIPNVSEVNMIKLKDAKRFNAALEAIKKLIGNGFAVFEENDFEGHKIFSIKSSLQQGAGNAAAPQFSYVITDEYFIINQGKDELLHKVLLRLKNAEGDSAWDSPEAQAALAALPKDNFGTSVSKGGSMVKLVLTTLAELQELGSKGASEGGAKGPKGPKAPNTKSKGKSDALGEMNWFDPSATPSDEVFSRYFGTGASGLYNLPDAFNIKVIMLPVVEK